MMAMSSSCFSMDSRLAMRALVCSGCEVLKLGTLGDRGAMAKRVAKTDAFGDPVEWIDLTGNRKIGSVGR
jgi:hypothetical protein